MEPAISRPSLARLHYSSLFSLAKKRDAYNSIGFENISLLSQYLIDMDHWSCYETRNFDLGRIVSEVPKLLKANMDLMRQLQHALAEVSHYVLAHEVDDDMIASIAGFRDSLVDMEQSSASQRQRLEATQHLGSNNRVMTSITGSDANSSVSFNPSSPSLAVMPTATTIFDSLDSDNNGSVTLGSASNSHLSSSINGSNVTSSVLSAAVVGGTLSVGLQSALAVDTTLSPTADIDIPPETAVKLDEEPLQSLITSVSEEPEQSDLSQQRDSAAAVVSVTTAVEDDVKLTVCSLIDSVEGSNTSIIVSSSVPPPPPVAVMPDDNIAASDDANSTARPGTSTSKSTAASSRTARPWPRGKSSTKPLQAAVGNSASSTAIATRSTDRTLAPASAANRQMLCVEGSSAVMPIIPIPPPPPLATGAMMPTAQPDQVQN